MLDQTTAIVLGDSIKSPAIDLPRGSSVVRVEPVIPNADFDKGLFVDVVLRLDGIELSRARLDMSYRTHPSLSLSFAREVQGKIDTEVIPVGGKASVGARVTAGDEQTLPAKLERPARIGVR